MAKTIEVDESVFLSQTQLAKTVQGILANKVHRKTFLKAYKGTYPDVSVPEIDAAEPLDDAIGAVRKEMADWRKEQEDRQAKRDDEEARTKLASDVNGKIARIRKDEKLTDEGEAALRKVMEEKGLIDPDVAWAYFERTHPPTTPSSPVNYMPTSPIFDIAATSNEAMKALIASRGEDNNAVNTLVNEALTEVRAANSRR